MEPRNVSKGAAAVLCLVLAATAARAADRVTVKGTVLEGKVKSITKKEIVMETVYGKGDIVIATEDVESIATEAPFHVYHGDDVDTTGPVIGLSPESVRIGADAGDATDISFSDIYVARRDPGPDGDLLEHLAVDLAYWTTRFDLSLTAAQATADTLALGMGIASLREKGPSRLRLESGWRLGTQKNRGQDEQTTENEIRALVRQEYDVAERIFAFGAVDAEYDEIERLSIRSTPRLGLGYVVYKTETARFAVDAGGAYVLQRFFGGETENYPALALGGEHSWKLPFAGASWQTRVDYTPSVFAPFSDFVIRGETGLLVPLSNSIALKASLIDLYNATAAENTDKNNLTTALGISVGF